MRKAGKTMAKEFKLYELGYDFMGYHLNKGDIFTYHHLIIAKRNEGPYARWNGAILCGQTSHPYLHTIESIDYDRFCAVTSEMFDMNMKGYLDPSNIAMIDDILCSFEKEHCGDYWKSGKPIIKEEYVKRMKLR